MFGYAVNSVLNQPSPCNSDYICKPFCCQISKEDGDGQWIKDDQKVYILLISKSTAIWRTLTLQKVKPGSSTNTHSFVIDELANNYRFIGIKVSHIGLLNYKLCSLLFKLIKIKYTNIELTKAL